MKRRILAIVLALVLALSLLPTAALAENVKPVMVGETGYDTLSEATTAAEPDENGVITYTITGKVKVTGTGWVQVAKDGLSGLKKVAFVGTGDDAELCITQGAAIMANQSYDIDVSFVNLTLSKLNPQWTNDYGHSTNYFTCWLRNTGAAENTVTYTNCTFPNGVCNNQYGKTVFTDCTFSNPTGYNLWNYGGGTKVEDSEFSGKRGVKMYNEGTLATPPSIEIKNTTFTGMSEKAAIVVSKASDVTLDNVDATGCTAGLLQKDIEGSSGDQKITIPVNGTGISGEFNVTGTIAGTVAEDEFNISEGTLTAADGSSTVTLDPSYLATGTSLGEDGTVAKLPVAKVGDEEFSSLTDAFAALTAEDHTLALLNESAWDAATPVYWKTNGAWTAAAKLTDALTAAYKANAGAITIVCRPNTDVGTMTHGHVADDLTIYGNNAYLSGGECDLEVDTFKFSRTTGAQANDGAYLEKDITITAYELDNLGVWGQRSTTHTVNINLNDCDGKDNVTLNVQRVYISGTSGVNNITVTGCDFLTKATALYSNADGSVVIDGCTFTDSQAPINFNHKANGTQTVTVKNSTLTRCGDNGDWKAFAAPIRFVNSGDGTQSASVEDCNITDTVGNNGDILLGDGRTGEASHDVTLTVTSTAADVQAQQPGYYAAGGTVANGDNMGSKTVEKSETLTTSASALTQSGDKKITYTDKSGNTVTYMKTVDDTTTTLYYEGEASLTDNYAAVSYTMPDGSTLVFKGTTLRAVNDLMRAYWEVSKNSTGCDYNADKLPTNHTGTLTWTIYGTVEQGNYLNSGALVLPALSGGYIWGSDGGYGWKNIEVKAGTEDATIVSSDSFDDSHIYISTNTEKTTITGVTIDGSFYAIPSSGCELTFENCEIQGELRVPSGEGTIKVTRCRFTGDPIGGATHENNEYPLFSQAGGKLIFENNTVKDDAYKRGMNVGGTTPLTVEITGNNIGTVSDGYSAIQLSGGVTEAKIEGNTIKVDNGNALTLHDSLRKENVTEVSVANNTIIGNGYLLYDDAKANGNEFNSENLDIEFKSNSIASTIDKTKGIDKNGDLHDVSPEIAEIIKKSTQPTGGSSYGSRINKKTEDVKDELDFADVSERDYYYDAVKWAAENGITGGVSSTRFGPGLDCTRGQTMTFLWRAMGEPEPESLASSLTDVMSGSYYYKAVLWAMQEGVTTGMGANRFAPDKTVTRGQFVTFLYRLANASGSGEHPFTDVPAGSYYEAAIAWAYAEGITKGTGATTFSPDAPCTRAQIITFLYRYFDR